MTDYVVKPIDDRDWGVYSAFNDALLARRSSYQSALDAVALRVEQPDDVADEVRIEVPAHRLDEVRG